MSEIKADSQPFQSVLTEAESKILKDYEERPQRPPMLGMHMTSSSEQSRENPEACFVFVWRRAMDWIQMFLLCPPLHPSLTGRQLLATKVSRWARAFPGATCRPCPASPQTQDSQPVGILCNLNQRPANGRGVHSVGQVSYTIVANPSLHFNTKANMRRWATPSELALFQGFPILPALSHPGVQG